MTERWGICKGTGSYQYPQDCNTDIAFTKVHNVLQLQAFFSFLSKSMAVALESECMIILMIRFTCVTSYLRNIILLVLWPLWIMKCFISYKSLPRTVLEVLHIQSHFAWIQSHWLTWKHIAVADWNELHWENNSGHLNSWKVRKWLHNPMNWFSHTTPLLSFKYRHLSSISVIKHSFLCQRGDFYITAVLPYTEESWIWAIPPEYHIEVTQYEELVSFNTAWKHRIRQ